MTQEGTSAGLGRCNRPGAGAHAVEEAGGGIHVERGADYHKDVGFGHQLGGGGDVGHRFLEEYDVGAYPVAVDNGVGGGFDGIGAEGVDAVFIIDGPYFHQLAVEVQHVRRAGAFMQVVDVSA